jgi:hypothetical protein
MKRIETSRALAAGAAVTALVAVPILLEPARLVYAAVFCLLVPGIGWAFRSGSGDVGDKVALAVTISTSATILVATAMVATGTWSVAGGAAALVVIAVLGFVPDWGAERGRKAAWDGH